MKFRLSRIRLDQGGYESDGTYWGTGQPLYFYWSEELNPDGETCEDYIRADNREHAKAIILKKYPTARFYN